MTTPYVPVVVVMPREHYDRLVAHFALVELPADIRQIMADNGWTQEAIMLGQALVHVADMLAPST